MRAAHLWGGLALLLLAASLADGAISEEHPRPGTEVDLIPHEPGDAVTQGTGDQDTPEKPAMDEKLGHVEEEEEEELGAAESSGEEESSTTVEGKGKGKTAQPEAGHEAIKKAEAARDQAVEGMKKMESKMEAANESSEKAVQGKKAKEVAWAEKKAKHAECSSALFDARGELATLQQVSVGKSAAAATHDADEAELTPKYEIWDKTTSEKVKDLLLESTTGGHVSGTASLGVLGNKKAQAKYIAERKEQNTCTLEVGKKPEIVILSGKGLCVVATSGTRPEEDAEKTLGEATQDQDQAGYGGPQTPQVVYTTPETNSNQESSGLESVRHLTGLNAHLYCAHKEVPIPSEEEGPGLAQTKLGETSTEAEGDAEDLRLEDAVDVQDNVQVGYSKMASNPFKKVVKIKKLPAPTAEQTWLRGCITKDKGYVMVKHMKNVRMDFRRDDGGVSQLLVDYIKVAACSIEHDEEDDENQEDDLGEIEEDDQTVELDEAPGAKDSEQAGHERHLLGSGGIKTPVPTPAPNIFARAKEKREKVQEARENAKPRYCIVKKMVYGCKYAHAQPPPPSTQAQRRLLASWNPFKSVKLLASVKKAEEAAKATRDVNSCTFAEASVAAMSV